MNIGIDARSIDWYKGTGIGTYTKKVLTYMLKLDKHNNYHIYWSGKNYENFQKKNSNVILTSKKHHRFFEQHYIPSNLKLRNIDLYHIPQNGIDLSENIYCKKIITLHDLIPYTMPQTVGKGYLMKFLEQIPKAIKNCNGIITVSEYSKKDILKFFPINKDKIFVVPLAADNKYIPLNKEICRYKLKKIYNIKNPFILYIGGFSPRKNVKSLIIAFSKIYNKLNVKHNLVIVGSNKDERNYLLELAKNLNIASNVIFTGYVSENFLPIFYNACSVFVYPSFYEGFGLPPLEAMSCGAPVITSNTTSIPEVVGNSGLLINPFDINTLIESLEKLLNEENLREKFKYKGLKRASLFSWEKTASKTLEIYKKVIES